MSGMSALAQQLLADACQGSDPPLPIPLPHTRQIALMQMRSKSLSLCGCGSASLPEQDATDLHQTNPLRDCAYLLVIHQIHIWHPSSGTCLLLLGCHLMA